ncbi:MAG: acetyl-CoA carboxylase biotin carboxyl carrier protein subunit [Crocinitomicaceae bacterium]
MENQFNIEGFLSNANQVSKITDSIYKVDQEVIEILEINYDLKIVKVRHNHLTHHIQFKNNLDFTLDKMGIKRTFEQVSSDIKAPMPGKVLEVMVKSGDIIEKGQPLLILEAMKMENVLKADSAATIKSIIVGPSESVESGQLLIELELVE